MPREDDENAFTFSKFNDVHHTLSDDEDIPDSAHPLIVRSGFGDDGFFSPVPHSDDDRDENDDEARLLARNENGLHRKPNGVSRNKEMSDKELALGIIMETAPTLLATVIGMIFTGELLERVSTWSALKQLDELFILIPILNNMKGSLEMNLSARLSTAANTGVLDRYQARSDMVGGSLVLLQMQALLMSVFASVVSFALGKLAPASEAVEIAQSLESGPRARRRCGRTRTVARAHPAVLPLKKSRSGLSEFLSVTSISMSSASVSGAVLGSFMCSVILSCRRYGLDPDNIATPLAQCLGDFITLTLLSFLSTFLTSSFSNNLSLPIIVCISGFVLLGFVANRTIRSPQTRPWAKEGWIPLILGTVISSLTGMVLDRFVTKWEAFGSLAIVSCGMPGAIGSVFVSRLSTELHAAESSGHAAPSQPRDSRFSKMTITGGILYLVGLPVIVIYLAFVYLAGWLVLPFLFAPLFIIGVSTSVLIALVLAKVLTEQLWKRGLDPDVNCLPIHSSFVEFVGVCALVLVFVVARLLGIDIELRGEA